MSSSTAFAAKLAGVGQQCPLIGVVAQHMRRRPQLQAGGVGASHQQRGNEHAKFVGAEAVTVVLGSDQIGDQVAGQNVAPAREHLVDVAVQRLPSGQDPRRLVGRVPAEGLQNNVGPVGELFPVLGWCAEQCADDRDRVLAGYVGDHIAAAAADLTIDEAVDDLDDRRAQSCGRLRREGLAHQSAQAAVPVAVEAEDVLGRLGPTVVRT